jgi:hypothetical protein
MSNNDITGARLVSRVNDKNYEDGYDRIFRNKPSCLDAAYERKAMQDGMNSSPVFEENKLERCVIHDNEQVEND